mmetsp:Transcript_48529/g.75787  ORF Transcript_48529/g.75787 Transcript_48529/m.75787 type:complete len:99 (+) Transcript_48529:491-787(+)
MSEFHTSGVCCTVLLQLNNSELNAWLIQATRKFLPGYAFGASGVHAPTSQLQKGCRVRWREGTPQQTAYVAHGIHPSAKSTQGWQIHWQAAKLHPGNR